MPIAKFEMPDGRIGRFEVPLGTSPEEAQKLILSDQSILDAGAKQGIDTDAIQNLPSPPNKTFNPGRAFQEKVIRESGDLLNPPQEAINFINQREFGVDYFTGIQDKSIRADFSRMDTEAERVQFLTKTFGKNGFSKDQFGAWIIQPEGLKKIGASQDTVPVAFDEQGNSLADVADLRGDAPVIAGSLLAAALTGGNSIWVQAIGSGLGAGIGLTLDEMIDVSAGENLETPGEFGKRFAKDTALAAGSDLLGGAVARKLLAPQGGRFTPDTKLLVDEASEIGVTPPMKTQVQTPGGQPGILARMQAMTDRVFGGNPLDEANRKALLDEAERLGNVNILDNFLGKQTSSVPRADPGEAVVSSINKANDAFRKQASQHYAKVDALTGGQPIIPTDNLKQTVSQILEEVPKRADTGAPVATSPEMKAFLDDFANLGDHVSITQMQAIRQRLADAVYTGDLAPGLSSRQARLMLKSTGEALEDAGKFNLTGETAQAVKAQLKKANDFYRQNIKLFDDQLIAKITRDQGKSGAIDPDLVVQAVFKKQNPGRIHKIKRLVEPKKWEVVEQRAMEDILRTLVKRGEDPRVALFSGNGMLKTLDGFGRESLEAMFGKVKTDQLYRLGRVAQLVSKNSEKHGGLVAANIALHPIKNLGLLAKFRVMSAFMNSKTGLKWLTEGVTNPVGRQAAINITKAAMLMATLAEDETGVANLTLNAPEKPIIPTGATPQSLGISP